MQEAEIVRFRLSALKHKMQTGFATGEIQKCS
jgi:hypothetical protein